MHWIFSGGAIAAAGGSFCSQKARTYLLELLNVDVELPSKLILGLAEGTDLPRELMTFAKFGFLRFLELVVPCDLVGDFHVFRPQKGLKL